MKTILIYLTVFTAMTLAGFAQTFDTCLVSANIYRPDLRAKDSACIEVVQIIENNFAWSVDRATYCADSTGTILMPLPQNSVAYLYSPDIRSLGGSTLGKPVSIPASSTATLAVIQPPTPVPAQYVVAIGSSADTATTVRYVDSNRVQKGFVTTTKVRELIAASPGGVDTTLLLQYSDSNRTQKGFVTVTGARQIVVDAIAAIPGGVGAEALDTAKVANVRSATNEGKVTAAQSSADEALDTAQVVNVRSATNEGKITTAQSSADVAFDTAQVANVRSSTNEGKIGVALDTAKVSNVRSATNEGKITAAQSSADEALDTAQVANAQATTNKNDIETLNLSTLLKADTANNVRVTHAVIPGLANADPTKFVTTDATGTLSLAVPAGGGVVGDSLDIRVIVRRPNFSSAFLVDDSVKVHLDTYDPPDTLFGADAGYKVGRCTYHLRGFVTNAAKSASYRIIVDTSRAVELYGVEIKCEGFRQYSSTYGGGGGLHHIAVYPVATPNAPFTTAYAPNPDAGSSAGIKVYAKPVGATRTQLEVCHSKNNGYFFNEVVIVTFIQTIASDDSTPPVKFINAD